MEDGLARLPLEEVRLRVTEALSHAAEEAHAKLVPYLAMVMVRVHKPGDTAGLKKMLGAVMGRMDEKEKEAGVAPAWQEGGVHGAMEHVFHGTFFFLSFS
jgi:hypothetical protein